MNLAKSKLYQSYKYENIKYCDVFYPVWFKCNS